MKTNKYLNVNLLSEISNPLIDLELNSQLKNKYLRVIRMLLFVLILLQSLSVLSQPNYPPGDIITAVKSGNWASNSTWDAGRRPLTNEVVIIPEGISIFVGANFGQRHRFIDIQGKINFGRGGTARLIAETIWVGPNGTLEIGRPGARILDDATASLVFTGDNPVYDDNEVTRGLIVQGNLSIVGAPKKPYHEVSSQLSPGATSLNVKGAIDPLWKVGDEIVIPGTHFQIGQLVLNPSPGNFSRPIASAESIKNTFQDEKVTVTSISGNTISFAEPLQYYHRFIDPDMSFHVANLTRNVTISSANEDIEDRAHAMFMKGSSVFIQGAKFYRMGRTNKRIPLDDLEPSANLAQGARKRNNASIQNRRGRYAVHFHLNGYNESDLDQALATVKNSVVEDTPGWGYVNHSSHVDFIDNVVFNFVGSGFVTESGNELGSYIGNFAIQGHGHGELLRDRIAFNNKKRPLSINDMAYNGEGFWFQGPAIRVVNNKAASCNGSGMLWFSIGTVDTESIGASFTPGRWIGFPRSIAEQIYPGIASGNPNPARLRVGYENVGEDVLSIRDMPILEFSDFEAYGSYAGLTFRFNNFISRSLLKDHGLPYDDHHVRIGPVRWQPQPISDVRLWNNFEGIEATYTNGVQLNDVTVLNRHRYSHNGQSLETRLGVKAEHNVTAWNLGNMIVDGYDIGIERARIGDFANSESIRNALGKRATKEDASPCSRLLIQDQTWVGEKDIRIGFNQDNNNQKKILVRFKTGLDITWSFQEFDTNQRQVIIKVPNGGRNYILQVLRGCSNSVAPLWSEEKVIRANPSVRLTNVNTEGDENNIMLYPNPVNNKLIISGNTSNKLIKIYDLLGAVKISKLLDETENEINVSELSNGIYMVRIIDINNRRAEPMIYKIVKTN
ncbi:T9SS type A sorting domain-containing protein [uncultured Aquimarina sp.]|uniref:T9SS type A sorting domain-containing protein n=1 Tax=uncultured Aquimarina sp. TaxID=575652 RepID=UPI002636AB42|nr:T9SS type A sorting domain-containing protein [uncultured Aquimarina sp.]